MQSGADAAAYAAALELAQQGLDQAPDLAAMQAVADDAASRNGVGTAVTLNVPPLSGPAAGDPQSVEVIVTEPAPVYFTGLFMGAAPPSRPAPSPRPWSRMRASGRCILPAKGAPVSGGANVDLDCGVVVNSNHPDAALDQSGTSCLSATSIGVTGGYRGLRVAGARGRDAQLWRSAELLGGADLRQL